MILKYIIYYTIYKLLNYHVFKFSSTNNVFIILLWIV